MTAGQRNAGSRRLTPEELRRVLRACGIDPGRVVSCEELGEGTYNTAYRVRTDGDGYVLKVAPDPRAASMTYERNLMRTEALFYRRAATSVPVPRLVHVDHDREVLDTDFLLMSELPGTPWSARPPDDADRDRLRGELGAVLARQHRITGTAFGWPQLGLAPTWRAAFRAMVGSVLDDAARFRVPLPVPAGRILALLDEHGEVFDEVTKPALVHFDLWDGNILLDGPRLGGLIDGERAFWGDPLAETVSLALFGDIERDEAFLAGYRAAGGEPRFGPAERFRLAAYRTHLYLIMLVETVPRGLDEQRRRLVTRQVTPHLAASLRAMTMSAVAE